MNDGEVRPAAPAHQVLVKRLVPEDGRSTQQPSRATCSRGLGCKLSPHPPELSRTFRVRMTRDWWNANRLKHRDRPSAPCNPLVAGGQAGVSGGPAAAVSLAVRQCRAWTPMTRGIQAGSSLPPSGLARLGHFESAVAGIARSPALNERATPVRARPGRNPRRPRVVSAPVNAVRERLWGQQAS